MRDRINKMYHNKVVRYIFFGGLTTLVNFGSYALLRAFTPLSVFTANVISVSLAILFAYVTNKICVFDSKTGGLLDTFLELCRFVGGRLSTMAIEVGGVSLMDYLGMNDMIAKLVTQFIVLVLNYLISRFLVFTGRKKPEDPHD